MIKRRNFYWPDDLWLLFLLYDSYPDVVIGGSFSEHFYTSPETPNNFKDLDISVGKAFLDNFCEKNESAREVMRSDFPYTDFDEMGMWGKKRNHVFFGEVKYPAKFLMFVDGIMVDAFISTKIQPHNVVECKGHFLKMMKPEDRLAALDSIIAAGADRGKKQIVRERRERLLNLLGKNN